MSVEGNPGRVVSKRGGCLDALISVTSFGRYGVETTETYPERVMKPSRVSHAVGVEFPVEEGTPIAEALRTGESVIVHNFNEINKPTTTRRIVRNKDLS